VLVVMFQTVQVSQNTAAASNSTTKGRWEISYLTTGTC